MKKCELCGRRFKPKRAAARYCSVGCRQRAYRERQREARPQYRLERALLTAIRELRSGQGTEALMTIRLAADDFELATKKAPKQRRAKQKKPAEAKPASKRPRRRAAVPPGPPPKRAKRPRKPSSLPKPKPTKAARVRRSPRSVALDPATDLRLRFEHVLESGAVSQAELANALGLPDGSQLSRWRRGGPLSPDRQRALDELLERCEWELFVGETLD